MIGYLRGKIIDAQPPLLILDVAGVGYEIETPMSTFYQFKEQDDISLYTHMVVREDAQLLFGFADSAQRAVFRQMLKISGVGPKVGLAILSTFDVNDLVFAIDNEDATALTRVPGIGKKTAELMVIGLRDKLKDIAGTSSQTMSSSERVDDAESHIQDAISALVALGYKAPVASKTVRAVAKEHSDRDEIIKQSLRQLSRH